MSFKCFFSDFYVDSTMIQNDHNLHASVYGRWNIARSGVNACPPTQTSHPIQLNLSLAMGATGHRIESRAVQWPKRKRKTVQHHACTVTHSLSQYRLRCGTASLVLLYVTTCGTPPYTLPTSSSLCSTRWLIGKGICCFCMYPRWR